MKKIPTLFLRRGELTTKPVPGDDPGGEFLVSGTVRPGCEWVLEGKGVATRMWDGTCCLVKDGKLRKRHFWKGDEAPILKGFVSASDMAYMGIGQPGWLPVTDAPEDKWHREGLANLYRGVHIGGKPAIITPNDGTYELCGPKINGNPDHCNYHVLVPHGQSVLTGFSHKMPYIKEYLERFQYLEGIVFWHQDDEHLPYHERRMAKIKRRDFGLEWPLRELEE